MELTITECSVCGGKLDNVVTVKGDGDIPSVTCAPCTNNQSWSN